MIVDWVKQEHDHGCGAATFAMLTNRTYAGAVATIKTHDRWHEGGVTHFTIDQYLAEDGFAVARRFTHVDGVARDIWPVEPFAEAHYCTVSSAMGTHFVVLLRDGTVLDPADPRPRRLTDYERVWNIAAVTPIESADAADRTQRG